MTEVVSQAAGSVLEVILVSVPDFLATAWEASLLALRSDPTTLSSAMVGAVAMLGLYAADGGVEKR